MGLASQVIAAASSQLGIPYQWGGESANHDFDCSGLVQWAYKTAGINLPRTSQEQSAAATPITAADLLPGDLVFSAGSDGTAAQPGHVGIYMGAGNYIDAPYTGQVIRIEPIPKGATYGRIPGITSDVKGNASVAQAGPGGYTDTTAGITSRGQCSSGGGFSVPLTSVSIGTHCQIKALTGGLMVGMGGITMLAGTLLIAAYGLKSTSAGKAVTQAAGFTPIGRVAKLAGGR